MVELKNCPVCDVDKWENMDHVRDQQLWYNRDFRENNEPVGFKICQTCGFITYDYVAAERLHEFYERQRPIMNSNCIITCNRKNAYHDAFFEEDIIELFNKKIQTGVKDLNFLDVGCAQGSFLDFYRKKTEERLPRNNISYYGTEWSSAFAAFAKYEYDLIVSDEIDESKKYDFVSYYHVLEHLQYPARELDKIKKVLKDDGILYLSVPVWIDKLDEEAYPLNENYFEEYYHLNHVNVFTAQSFRNLLNKCGLEIIKEDTNIYGFTVFCKKSEFKEIVKEDYKQIKSVLEKEKKACDFMSNPNNRQPEEALKHIQRYPDAWISLALNKDNMKNFKNQEKILLEASKMMPDSAKIQMQLGRMYMQWDESTPGKGVFYSNNIKKAEKYFNVLLREKPGNEDVYFFMSQIEGVYKKNYDIGVNWLKKQIEINPKCFLTAWNMISVFWNEKRKNDKR